MKKNNFNLHLVIIVLVTIISAYAYSNIVTLKSNLLHLDDKLQLAISEVEGMNSQKAEFLVKSVSRAIKKYSIKYTTYISLLLIAVVLGLIGILLSSNISVSYKLIITFFIIMLTLSEVLFGAIS